MLNIGKKFKHRNVRRSVVVKKTINRKYEVADWWNPNDISNVENKIPQAVPILYMETSSPLAPFPNYPKLFNYKPVPYHPNLQYIADSKFPYVGLYPKLLKSTIPDVGVLAQVKINNFKVELLPFTRIQSQIPVPMVQNREETILSNDVVPIHKFETSNKDSPNIISLTNAIRHSIQELEMFFNNNANDSYTRYMMTEQSKKVLDEYLPYLYYAAAVKFIKPWKIDNYSGINNLISMPSLENQLKYSLSFIEKSIIESKFRHNINSQINAETQKQNRDYEELLKRKFLQKRLGVNDNRNNNEKFLKTMEKI